MLEARFRAGLSGEPLSPAVRAIAQARFDRPAIFGRVCPHALDADKRDAFVRLAAGDASRAQAVLFSVLRRDPRDAVAELGLATCAERLSDTQSAKQRLTRISESSRVPAPLRLRADERLGDLAYAAGDDDVARARYDAALARAVDEDARRSIEVKKHGLDNPLARAAIGALLVGKPPEGTDASLAFEELGRWSTLAPEDGLPLYLLARSAVARGDFPRGNELLRRALQGEMALPSTRREAARQHVIVGCALGDAAIIEDGLGRFAATEVSATNRGARLRRLGRGCLGDRTR